MPNSEDNWTEIWNARENALSQVLGRTTGVVHHAIQPFYLGGTADVLPFPNFVPGLTYVTAELTGEDVGQKPSSLGNYELMICAKQNDDHAVGLISKLARYTCDAKLEAGQTMDLGSYFKDSSLKALLFAHPGDQPVFFEFLGQRYGLLLCIGITADELAFARSHGSSWLLESLKRNGVFPYTIPDRPSVPLSS